MSFSSDIKDELGRIQVKSRQALMAEMIGVMDFCGGLMSDRNGSRILISTENVILAKKILQLVKRNFAPDVDLEVKKNGRKNQYRILITEASQVEAVLNAACYGDEHKKLDQITKREDCKKAYLRIAFMASGTASNPEKSYHLEITCRQGSHAGLMMELLAQSGIEAKLTSRKNRIALYMKDGDTITDTLNYLGAFYSSMQMENARIIKDMRNATNRQINCDTANISKQVKTANRQIEDIRFLMEMDELEGLNQSLQEMARVRLEYPDASLQELGEYLDPPVGKSGVNHRLRKLSKLASDLRGE